MMKMFLIETVTIIYFRNPALSPNTMAVIAHMSLCTDTA